ncbi:MAG: signlal transduction histidine kinase, LytS [Acidobacteria bacterium]|nr:MAG: signlal transduction histidine kinase, LytS [Acidobacteriota bacterium]
MVDLGSNHISLQFIRMLLGPFFKSRSALLFVAAASILFAGLGSFTTYVNARVAGRTAWREVLFVASLWLVFAPLTWIPYTFARRFPPRLDGIVPIILAHSAGAMAMSLLWTLLGIILARLITTRPPVPFVRYYVSSLLTNMPLSVFLYFAVLGCIYAFSYYREARQRQEREARLSAQLSEARLSALRMQLHPHFLFNSLNAITVLVRDQKTQDASRMLELLGGVLRQVLQSENRQEVTLEEELQFIEKYLAIEQVRFSDRLEIIWSIDAAARDALVPSFILQPLVENAIRHGVGKRSEEGIIEIAAAVSDNDVLLTVMDNGPGYSAGSEGGVGLANTHARLETVFGDRAQLDVRKLNGLGTVATVRFPLRKRTDG